MVTDQEPRYRLVDADGNVVGSLFAEPDGTLKLQEGTSGNDNELSLTTQGALEVEQLSGDTEVTGELTAVGQSRGISISALTIPDDDAKSIDSTSRSLVMIASSFDGAATGMLSTSSISTTVEYGEKLNATGLSQLSGTDGPDGTLNTAVESNTLFFENRTGSERTYTIIQFGR